MVLFKKFIGALALIAFSVVALNAHKHHSGSYDGYSDPSQQVYDPSQQSYDPSQQSYDPSQQGYAPTPQPYQQGYAPSAPAPQPYQQYNPCAPAPQPYQQGYAPSAPAPQPYQQYNPGAPAPQPYQQGVMLGAVAPQAQPQSGGQQQAQQNFVPQQSQQQLPLVQAPAPAPANTQVISVTAVERDTTQDINQDDTSLKTLTAEEAQLEKGSTTRLNNAFGSLFGTQNSKEVTAQQNIFNDQVKVLNNGVTYCSNVAVKLQKANAISANSSTGAAKILAALNKEIDAIGTDVIAAQKLVTRTITYGKDSGTGSRADVLRAAVADMQTLLSQVQGILGRLQLIDTAINGSANVDATEYDYATLSANWTTAKVVKPAK